MTRRALGVFWSQYVDDLVNNGGGYVEPSQAILELARRHGKHQHWNMTWPLNRRTKAQRTTKEAQNGHE